MSRFYEPESDRNEPVYVDVHVVAVGARAILVRPDDNPSGHLFPSDSEVWIPKSEILADSDIDGDSNRGEDGTLAIPKWLADDRGLS